MDGTPQIPVSCTVTHKDVEGRGEVAYIPNTKCAINSPTHELELVISGSR